MEQFVKPDNHMPVIQILVPGLFFGSIELRHPKILQDPPKSSEIGAMAPKGRSAAAKVRPWPPKVPMGSCEEARLSQVGTLRKALEEKHMKHISFFGKTMESMGHKFHW